MITCRAYSMITWSGMTFGYCDSQTLRHLTFFCGDFTQKESTAIAQTNLEGLKHEYRPLSALTNKLVEM
jgi:hypothetical protein